MYGKITLISCLAVILFVFLLLHFLSIATAAAAAASGLAAHVLKLIESCTDLARCAPDDALTTRLGPSVGMRVMINSGEAFTTRAETRKCIPIELNYIRIRRHGVSSGSGVFQCYPVEWSYVYVSVNSQNQEINKIVDHFSKFVNVLFNSGMLSISSFQLHRVCVS